MTDCETHDSNIRIDRLEAALQCVLRRGRMWRRVACVAGGLIALSAFVGAQKASVPRTVEAEAFILRDGAGRVRASLEMDRTTKQPSFYLADGNGNTPLLLNLDENGSPLFTLFGKGLKTNLQVSMGEDGSSPSLNLIRDGLNGLALHAGKDGWTYFSVSDKSGQIRFMISERDGAVGLNIKGENNRTQMQMGIDPEGDSNMFVLDKDGKTLFRAPNR